MKGNNDKCYNYKMYNQRLATPTYLSKVRSVQDFVEYRKEQKRISIFRNHKNINE
jgi:hypothetical protein